MLNMDRYTAEEVTMFTEMLYDKFNLRGHIQTHARAQYRIRIKESDYGLLRHLVQRHLVEEKQYLVR